ncbi:MAG: ATP-binding protein [bacterium]|nr:ATP-binding protein [bacterium]
MERYLIKQILLEQEEEIAEIFKGKIIKREIEPVAEEMIDSDLIKVIMGVRRCGKSVLAHLLLTGKKYGYVNFDDERLIGVKAEDLNDFLEVLKEIDPDFEYLLLDEVQNVKGWELFVNRLKRKGYKIVVSGSNSNLLSKELATHLTGRHFGIELYPFSFREFLSYKGIIVKERDSYITEKRAGIKKLLEEYLNLGGLPEALKIDAKKNYLRELFDKIITRDIVSRYNIKYVKDLKEIALYTVSNFSSKITYHKIKNIFEIKSVHTIKNYLGYLQEAYLVFQLNPFSFKLKEQIKQPRKIYSIDTGLINALVPKITFDYGKLMENLVFLELMRRGKEIYFYSQPNYEVDFLVKEGLKIKQLIQVSFSISDEGTRKREIKALLKGSKELRCNELIMITWDEQGEEKVNSKVIKIIPLWRWLLMKNYGKDNF